MCRWSDTRSAAIFVVVCALLCLELLALAFAIPLIRAKRNMWLNEEDAVRFSGTVADVEHRAVARVIRVHRNQLENLTPFFTLGLLWTLLGVSDHVGAVLFIVFAIARSGHVGFYLARMGRARTASHTVSFFVLVALAGGLVLHALSL